MPDVEGTTNQTVPITLHFPVEWWFEELGKSVNRDTLKREYEPGCAGNNVEEEWLMRVLLEKLSRDFLDYPETGTLVVNEDGTVSLDRPRDEETGQFVRSENDD